jgi:hypothetical protein
VSSDSGGEPTPENSGQSTKIGGVPITREDIIQALSELEQSTQRILPSLQRIGSPLALGLTQKQIWHIADRYKRQYPEDADYDKIEPPSTQAIPRLKAFRCLLRRELTELDGHAALAEQVWHDEDSLPDRDAEDARKRRLAEIIRREGQPKFKADLLLAYEGRCAVTGCNAAEALEAAHIRAYRGREFNKVSNGLLLRADIPPCSTATC